MEVRNSRERKQQNTPCCPHVLTLLHPHETTQRTNSSLLLSIYLIQTEWQAHLLISCYSRTWCLLLCNYKLSALWAGRKLVITGRELAGVCSWHHLLEWHFAHEASVHLATGLLLLQERLTWSQPHHKTRMQTTEEFRLATLAAL